MKSYRYFGIWSPVYKTLWSREILYIIYTFVMISFMLIYAATTIGDLCDNTDNLLMITDDVLFLVSISLCLLKLFFFHLYREQIANLINDIHAPVDFLMNSSERSVVLLLKWSAFWERVQEYMFGAGGAFLLIALTFLVPTDEGCLPMPAKFPFDYTVQPMYTVAFVVQTFGVMNAIVTLFSLDGLVLNFCRWTSVQLEILNSNFQHCQPHWPCSRFESIFNDMKLNIMNESHSEINCFVPFSIDDIHDNKAFVKRFKICIRHHCRIIDIVEKINELFGAGMLIQLGGYLFIICLSGFQGLLGTTGTDSLRYIFFAGVGIFILGIWCLYGNNLLFQSIDLMHSQWFSGWEDELTPEVTCLLIVSLARSGRVLELKAGNYYQISMDTFIMVLKTTYSVFAVLTTITEEAES